MSQWPFCIMNRSWIGLVLAQDVIAHFSLRRDLITCRPPRSHRPFCKSNNRGRFSENLIFRQTAINVLGLWRHNSFVWPDHEVPGCSRTWDDIFYKFPKMFLLTNCWRFENTPFIGLEMSHRRVVQLKNVRTSWPRLE